MPTDKLRILWSSNAPWAGSGYGVQTKHALNILADLQADGEPIDDLALHAFYGLNGGRQMMQGRTVYGNPYSNRDPWGIGFVANWYKDFGANLLVTLMDAWIYPAAVGNETNWVPYFPVDHEPVPPGVVGAVGGAMSSITMSQYGYAQAQQVGIESTYIPHCVDTGLMVPMDRARARDWLGIGEDAVLFGMVAANVGTPSRKAFPEVFAALQKAVERDPRVHLYIHSDPRPGQIGLDLVHLSQLYDVREHVSFTDPNKLWTHFRSEEDMAVLYSAFDVLLSPSYGEGFGVPIIEAQSCGTPVITHDCTAMPEITHGGWSVPRGHPWLTPQMAYQYMPNPEEIATTMLEVAAMGPEELAKIGEEGREWVVERYDILTVRDSYWRPWVHSTLACINEREERRHDLEPDPEEMAVPV